MKKAGGERRPAGLEVCCELLASSFLRLFNRDEAVVAIEVDFFDIAHSLDDGLCHRLEEYAKQLVVHKHADLELVRSWVPSACGHFFFSFFEVFRFTAKLYQKIN